MTEQQTIGTVELTPDQLQALATAQRLAQIKILTKEETASVLGVSARQVDKMRLAGLLKATRTGKEWMFAQDEILWLQKVARGADISSPEKMRSLARSVAR